MQEVVWFPFYLKKGFVLWIAEMEKKIEGKIQPSEHWDQETKQYHWKKNLCTWFFFLYDSTNKVDSVQQTRTGNISCILSSNPGREGSLRTRQKICLAFLNGTPNLDFQRHTSNRVQLIYSDFSFVFFRMLCFVDIHFHFLSITFKCYYDQIFSCWFVRCIA